MHLLIDDQKPRNLSAMPPMVFSSSLLKESSDWGLMFCWNTRKGNIDRGTDLLQANHWHCEAHPLLHLSSSASWPGQLNLTIALPPCRPWDSVENIQTSENFIVSCTWYVRSRFKKISNEKLSSGTSGFQKLFWVIRFSPQNRAYLCRWSFQFYP